MSLSLAFVPDEGGTLIEIDTDGDPVPPEIALAFGRALAAASEVLIGLRGEHQGDTQPDTDAPSDLPTYPRSGTRTL